MKILLIPISDEIASDRTVQSDARVRVYAPSKSTSNVAVCLIVKNETLYIDEWLDYHIALGFSPIYIYDNSPDFELKTTPRSGIWTWHESRRDEIGEHVVLIHFPVVPVQKAAYDRCVKEDAANSTFVALIDVDEFLVLKTFDNVVDFMDRHCDDECGQLSINWFMMSMGNETRYSPVPITRRNVHGIEYGTIKVILRPGYVADDLAWWHSVALRRGYMVDTNGKRRVNNGAGGFRERQANDGGPFDVAALHHYAFKSREEFRYKQCVRGTSLHASGETPFCNKQYYWMEHEQTHFDDSAWRQLVRMVPKYRIYDDVSATSNTTV
eukprot:CAMPEP_0172580736 /NCGR_PEP_ID=MMETSP1067-20121228/139910_1 /TAXON_ID=265564 ORGANISM="Thalassiosira punctigera, Strain Tpunct2005C2" /NCGR_SAMPLE_ID=MMETSP1067 /ASSEMBLY_ACC=CAM_ASM_000444 /LENGTH=324 /DNA_ID=CAMNT_0013373483 /DNA_START=152 /DNA_END=1126 /DNA_ORIENTATION=+